MISPTLWIAVPGTRVSLPIPRIPFTNPAIGVPSATFGLYLIIPDKSPDFMRLYISFTVSEDPVPMDLIPPITLLIADLIPFPIVYSNAFG